MVLLGTVFPLLVQALNGQQVTVGRPYFDTMTVPSVSPCCSSWRWHRRCRGARRAQVFSVAAWRLPGWTAVGCRVVLRPRRGARIHAALGLRAGRLCRSQRPAPTRAAGAGVARRRRGSLAGALRSGQRRHDRPSRCGHSCRGPFGSDALMGNAPSWFSRPGQSIRYDGHVFSYLGTRRFTPPEQERGDRDCPRGRGPVPPGDKRVPRKRGHRNPGSRLLGAGRHLSHPCRCRSIPRMVLRRSMSSSSPWLCGSG